MFYQILGSHEILIGSLGKKKKSPTRKVRKAKLNRAITMVHPLRVFNTLSYCKYYAPHDVEDLYLQKSSFHYSELQTFIGQFGDMLLGGGEGVSKE